LWGYIFLAYGEILDITDQQGNKKKIEGINDAFCKSLGQ